MEQALRRMADACLEAANEASNQKGRLEGQEIRLTILEEDLTKQQNFNLELMQLLNKYYGGSTI